jgi:regulator of PEP synthase PpsR (kinase-PPPase family)
MNRLHLHLLSDSTGETLEMIAKAALAQFEDVEVNRHFWPMVRSQAHLDRVMGDIAANPGLVLYTMVSHDIRRMLEDRCLAMGLPAVPVLDLSPMRWPICWGSRRAVAPASSIFWTRPISRASMRFISPSPMMMG